MFQVKDKVITFVDIITASFLLLLQAKGSNKEEWIEKFLT